MKPFIFIAFLLATFIAVMQSACLPSVVVLAYSPFIALVSISCSLPAALFWAALAGFCTDLFSAVPFGIHTLTAAFSCALLYRFRLNFFNTLALRLCIATALFSAVMLPVMLIMLFLFDQQLPVAGKSLLLDLIVMPFADAAYAFVWFVGPLLISEWGEKEWKLWRRRHAG